MDWTGCPYVEVIPGKLSGVPLVRRSRVPADVVFESHELGESVEQIAFSFDLRPEDIREILSFAKRLTANDNRSLPVKAAG